MEQLLIGGGAYAHGSYADIDGLFREQARELDPKRREAALHRIQQLVFDKVVVAPIYEATGMNGVGPRVEEAGLGLTGVRSREGQTFVHRSRERSLRRGRAINRADSVRRVHVGVKASDCSIFRREQELAGKGLAVLTDNEVNRTVEYIARGCGGFYTGRPRDDNCWCDFFA